MQKVSIAFLASIKSLNNYFIAKPIEKKNYNTIILGTPICVVFAKIKQCKSVLLRRTDKFFPFVTSNDFTVCSLN